MDSQSLQALVEHQTAELRALFPQITDCHTALVQWKEGDATRYSLHLDIRWPQHQSLVSGPARDRAEAAIEAGVRIARERMR
ncbi:MAG TPA: hypothetical protein VFZ81_00830 [Burkholderiales bacterium]